MSDRLKHTKGSTLLIVIIVMTIAFMLSSIVFGYALKTLRIMREVSYIEIADQVAEAGITDSIIDLCEKIDNLDVIGIYQIQTNTPFIGETGYSYIATVYEDGSYNATNFVAYPHNSQYKIKKNHLGDTPTLFTPFAIEATGSYKTVSVTQRVSVVIESTVDDYFLIKIYPCN